MKSPAARKAHRAENVDTPRRIHVIKMTQKIIKKLSEPRFPKGQNQPLNIKAKTISD